MSLARAADGGVAGHVADAVEVHGEAHRVKPQTRRGQRGLYPGVARADNGYITFSGIVYPHVFSSDKYRQQTGAKLRLKSEPA